MMHHGMSREARRSAAEMAMWGEGEPLRGVASTAAVMGHPIHPMLIPYPLAFLTAALATDVASQRTGDPFWARASGWLLGAGLVSGVAAGVVGAIDYYTIRRANEERQGKVHAYGNMAALALAGANLALRRRDRYGEVSTEAVALSALTAALLGVTGWAGGELSYRHMVGVAGHDDQHVGEERRYVA
jgi:uncharacterized membrane protein